MKEKKILVLVALLGLLHLPLLGQNLSGVYTIGTASGMEDYATIAAALDDLKSGTIIGDVEYHLGSGTYHEMIDLSSINNGAFTITFAGASREFTILHPLGQIAADKSGISITNTDHVVLKNFTLVMDDISGMQVDYEYDETRGINVSGGSDITLENLILYNSKYVHSESYFVDIASAVSLRDVEDVTVKSSDISGAGILIYVDDFQTVSINDNDFSEGQTHIYHFRTVNTPADGLQIVDNSFTGPFPTGRSASAIHLYGYSTDLINSSNSTNLLIDGNTIDTKAAGSGADIHGMYLRGQEGAIIRNNVVEGGSFGIRLGSSYGSEILSNEVHGASFRGLEIQLGNEMDVVNNIFTSSRQAVFLSAPSNVRFAHNTLYASGTESAFRIYRLGGDSLVVVNNIFSVENTASTEVAITDVTSTNIIIDNNLFSDRAHTYTVLAYRLGADIGQANGLEYYATSFSDWQTNQALYDQNSQSFVPTFVDADDYHITSNADYRFGTFIEDITSDIDGDIRDAAVGVDVGADQNCFTYNEVANIWACDSYEFDGVTLTASGQYQANLLSQFQCDSLVYLYLTIRSPDQEIVDVEACDSYEFDDDLLTTSGQYQGLFTNQHGCDSTVTLNLTLVDAYDEELVLDACEDYEFGQQLLTETGVYQELFASKKGCDSLVTLNYVRFEKPEPVVELNGVVLSTSEQEGVTYQWYNCDTEEVVDGADEHLLIPPATGNYYVEVNNGACASISECTFFDWILSANKPVSSEVRIYPTLTNGELTVDLLNPTSDVDIRLLSLDGNTLYHKSYGSFTSETFLFQQPTGIYFLQVRAAGAIVNTQRIIKK